MAAWWPEQEQFLGHRGLWLISFLRQAFTTWDNLATHSSTFLSCGLSISRTYWCPINLLASIWLNRLTIPCDLCMPGTPSINSMFFNLNNFFNSPLNSVPACTPCDEWPSQRRSLVNVNDGVFDLISHFWCQRLGFFVPTGHVYHRQCTFVCYVFKSIPRSVNTSIWCMSLGVNEDYWLFFLTAFVVACIGLK